VHRQALVSTNQNEAAIEWHNGSQKPSTGTRSVSCYVTSLQKGVPLPSSGSNGNGRSVSDYHSVLSPTNSTSEYRSEISDDVENHRRLGSEKLSNGTSNSRSCQNLPASDTPPLKILHCTSSDLICEQFMNRTRAFPSREMCIGPMTGKKNDQKKMPPIQKEFTKSLPQLPGFEVQLDSISNGNTGKAGYDQDYILVCCIIFLRL